MIFLTETNININNILQIFFGITYIFFLYGFIWSWAIFPQHKALSWLDRCIVSVALSFILAPLLIFIAHRSFNLPITDVYVALCLLVSNILALIIYWMRSEKK